MKFNFKNRTKKFIIKRPMTTFLIAIALLFAVIFVQNNLSKATTDNEPETAHKAKIVNSFQVGDDSNLILFGQVKKNNIVTIKAQTSGVVNRINVTPGQTVGRGTGLISLASTYTGANSFTVQRQIAETNYNNQLDTFEDQTKAITQQEDLALATKDNSDELRQITATSISETEELLQANRNVLDRIEEDIEDIKDASVDDSLRQVLDQQRSQYLSIVNQLEASLRSTKYQSDNNNPPAELSKIQFDLTMNQLGIQEKALALGLDNSKLQLSLARINESLMFPASPKSGLVEEVFVSVGDLVSPGTPLATIKLSGSDIELEINTSAQIARVVDKLKDSIIYLPNSTELAVKPQHISTEAVSGNMHVIKFILPNKIADAVTNNEFLKIGLPLRSSQDSEAILVPLEAVFQTQEKNYIFLNKENIAESKEVELGNIVGGLVEVISGLKAGDEVILDRSVISGQSIETQ